MKNQLATARQSKKAWVERPVGLLKDERGWSTIVEGILLD
jgi:hypothetical protein